MKQIENIRLKQIIKQNQTTNSVSQFSVSPTLSVTPQKPINDHFDDKKQDTQVTAQ
ncbi:20074_t:CDS:2, partial [Entrophospora sp. SA101]